MDELSNFFNFLSEYNKEEDKALRRVFSGKIKGTFLIEIKTRVLRALGNDIFKYYDFSLSKEKILTSESENINFDICRHILGLHSSHLIFLTEEERLEKERSEEYKRLLIKEVVENVKLRLYGSSFFRRKSLFKGENFIFYHVPYDLFVLCTRICELLQSNKEKSLRFEFISSIAHKSLSALVLLEENLLSNAFPLCRSATELYLKLFVLCYSPEAEQKYLQFGDYEVANVCGDQKYPLEFENIYKNRSNKSCQNKIEYLHYGWLDFVNDYHLNVMRPYSVSGIISYLKSKFDSDVNVVFNDIESLYKTCHIYSHGNLKANIYPLIEYFQIAQLLHYSVTNAYKILCGRLNISTDIDGIDIMKKLTTDGELLIKQRLQATDENLERYEKNHKY